MKQTKRFNYTSPIPLIICTGDKCIYILLTNIQNACSVKMWNFNRMKTPLIEGYRPSDWITPTGIFSELRFKSLFQVALGRNKAETERIWGNNFYIYEYNNYHLMNISNDSF